MKAIHFYALGCGLMLVGGFGRSLHLFPDFVGGLGVGMGLALSLFARKLAA